MESNILKMVPVPSILENSLVFIIFDVAYCQISCIEKRNRIKHQRYVFSLNKNISLCGPYMLSSPHRTLLFTIPPY